MKNKGRAIIGICLCIAASAVFAGCGKKSGGNSSTVSTVKLETGEIKDSSVVIKVGDTGVQYSEICNYVYLLKKQYNKSFGSELWKYNLGDSTIGDMAKEEIVNMVTQLKVIRSTAEEQDIALTTDEKDQAIQQAEEIVYNAGEKAKEKYCLTVQNLTGIFEDNILANKMFYVATDEVDTDISDEEAKQISIQYMEIVTNGTDSNGTVISMDDAAKKKALARIKKLRKSAKQSGDFLSIAQENTDSDSCELTMGRETDKLPSEVVNMAFELKKGELSDIIETSEGYFVVYCVSDYDEDATYSRKEEIIEENQTSMFKDKYAEWLKKCNVSISKSFWNTFRI